MRMDGLRESDNVEDRRRGGGARLALGGGMGTIVIVLIAMFLGVDPRQFMGGGGGGGIGLPGGSGNPFGQSTDPGFDDSTGNTSNDAGSVFVRRVLGSTEDIWAQLLPSQGRKYERPKLVLFRGQVQSACGFASAAVGPFYCPGDSQVYLDLSFFDELDRRFGAPGDFAQAYVIAHEIGHHVQNLLGISDRVHNLKQRLSEKEYNAMSVRMELQADFFAGVWAHHANRQQRILEPGDVEEGLRAANAIGDDTLQKQGRGHVVPDSFTHGSSAQRIKWFRKGLETGDLSQGDTFAVDQP